MSTGEVGILNVGAGDTKLSFNPKNPIECIRAARIVTDMIKRGYVLLVEVTPGEYQRVLRFEAARCDYIIADFDPLAPEPPAVAALPPPAVSLKNGVNDGPEIPRAPTGASAPKRRGRKPKERAIPAASTRAVAVGRTAGG